MTNGTGIFGAEISSFNATASTEATKLLRSFGRDEHLVGDLIKVDYTECEVLVHDHLRQKVGGLPLGCFLLATRLPSLPNATPDDEDASVMLLRVIGQCRLPNASETDLSRFQAGQRAAALSEPWDSDGKIDQFTLHQLRYAGVKCRVLGTFRMRSLKPTDWQLTFGADISNFYSGRGMKVFKPVGEPLHLIVNFVRSKGDDAHPLAGKRVPVGRVRYASSERAIDLERENIRVDLDPTDLIARRTALFGMSRTGKSNTTKVIASSVHRLREGDAVRGRVGQLIFDVNGEYANENTQDGGKENAACLKNVVPTQLIETDLATYGLAIHPNDPKRQLVKINFFGDDPVKWTDRESVRNALEPLLTGKQLVDEQLATETSKYVSNFRNTLLEPPQVLDTSASIRYRRAILAYRAALSAAGFAPPAFLGTAYLKGLFNKELLQALRSSTAPEAADYTFAAGVLEKDSGAWDQVADALRHLRKFIQDGQRSGYSVFNNAYQAKPGKDGRSWDDERLTGLLSIFEYPNGVRSLRPLLSQHDPSTKGDYAEKVVDDLLSGKLVIFDQSLGDPSMNRSAADRIMWSLFNRQKQAFISPTKDSSGNLVPPPDVLVYAEEAHNLLPASASADVSNIWSRVAKEGSKYRIGIVYATQEPSSIQANIMKNTDNWFVAHLNNSDETKELRKYYDFEDFVQSILQVPDAGFLRMRTLSNPYIVPIQVKKFEAKA